MIVNQDYSDYSESENNSNNDYEEEEVKLDYLSTNLIFKPNISVSDVELD